MDAANTTKVQIYVENIYTSELSEENGLQAWEHKPTANKTWASVKAYFVPLSKSKAHYAVGGISKHVSSHEIMLIQTPTILIKSSVLESNPDRNPTTGFCNHIQYCHCP